MTPTAIPKGRTWTVAEALERRVASLEAASAATQKTLERLELEQKYTREALDSRFTALNRGQDKMLDAMDKLTVSIQTMSGDPEQSPAGRALITMVGSVTVRIDESEAGLRALKTEVTDLTALANQLKGAMTFWKMSGIGSIIMSAGAVALAYFHMKGWI